MDTFSYTYLFTGPAQETYMEERHEPCQSVSVGILTQAIQTKQIHFGKAEAGVQDWHCTPQRMYIVVLSGIMQIETSSGQIKNFAAGEVLLADDTQGKGHITRGLQAVEYLMILL